MSSRGRPSKKDTGLAAPNQPISLGQIGSLSREMLVDHWIEAYGRPPPKGASRRLLEHAAAYNAQVKARGGLSDVVRRSLCRMASSPPEPAPKPAESPRRASLPSGSRLIREWRGKTHTVDVTERGFRYEGRRYGSLSEIAREITGTRWSGPRFFGT